jgi:hypothetical protein
MTILEATGTDDHTTRTPRKASVVKSGAGYRAEQGSDYEPRSKRRNRWLNITLAREDYAATWEANPGTRARAS